MSWNIELFASDNADDPDNISAHQGKFFFRCLGIEPFDVEVGDRNYKADGSLDEDIILRAKLRIKFFPFAISKYRFSGQHSIETWSLLKKMLRQPYLVFKSSDLPVFDGAADDYVPDWILQEYPVPAKIKWDGTEEQSYDYEKGIMTYSIEVEYEYVRGKTYPTPVTTEDFYSY